MGTECQKDYTEEAEKWLQGAEGRVCGLPEGVIEREMPAIQANLEARYDQMMEEKNATFVEVIEKMLGVEGNLPSDFGPKEKELLMPSSGTENLRPVTTTPEERRSMRETGEKLGISPARYVGTADVTRFPVESVKEVMGILNHPDMPKSFTKRETIGQVQYVNKQMIDPKTGRKIQGMHQTFVERDKKTGEIIKVHYTIYVFANEKNECPKGKELKEILNHEIIHGPNRSRIEEYVREHPGEAAKAIASQAKMGPPSNYSLESTEEWVCECYKCYIVDQSKLSHGMVEFLKNTSEYFSK